MRNEQTAGENNRDILDNSAYIFDNKGNVIKVGEKVNFLKQNLLSKADYEVSKHAEAVKMNPASLRYVVRVGDSIKSSKLSED